MSEKRPSLVRSKFTLAQSSLTCAELANSTVISVPFGLCVLCPSQGLPYLSATRDEPRQGASCSSTVRKLFSYPGMSTDCRVFSKQKAPDDNSCRKQSLPSKPTRRKLAPAISPGSIPWLLPGQDRTAEPWEIQTPGNAGLKKRAGEACFLSPVALFSSLSVIRIGAKYWEPGGRCRARADNGGRCAQRVITHNTEVGFCCLRLENGYVWGALCMILHNIVCILDPVNRAKTGRRSEEESAPQSDHLH